MNPEMKSLLDRVSAALAEDATDDTKRQGAEAAKTLHTLLSATPGAALVSPALAPTPLGQAVEKMRNAPPTVMLDALIAKLREYVPDHADRKPNRFTIPFVRVEAIGKPDGR